MRLKGFGKNYFSLMAIQAYVSTEKLTALFSTIASCSGSPLRVSINAPPSP
jgi:hypothetical protein